LRVSLCCPGCWFLLASLIARENECKFLGQVADSGSGMDVAAGDWTSAVDDSMVYRLAIQ
jgi:hypothetical protein